MSKFYEINEEYKALYYQMPKWLYTLEPYKSRLKSSHREAYMLLKDRLNYSIKNHWVDSEGKLYFIYTNQELAGMLGCSDKTVTNIKNTLIEVGLLIVKKQGFNPKTKQNNPSLLYLTKPELSATDVYNPLNLESSSGSVKFTSHNDTKTTTSNVDTKGSEKFPFPNIQPSSLQPRGQEKITVNQYDNSLYTKKIQEDTQLDFSSSSFTSAEIKAQNKDLVKNAPQYLTTSDDSDNFILSQKATKLLSLWCRTPKQICRMVQIILNAKNSVKKELLKLNILQDWQVKTALHLPGQYHENPTQSAIEVKNDIEITLRKVLNSIRRHDDADKPIRNVENYTFIAFKRHFKEIAISKLQNLVSNAHDSERLLAWFEN